MAHHAPIDPARLDSAQTWLASGNYDKALEELDRLEPALQNHPDILEIRCQIAAGASDWKLGLEAASLLVETAPERRFGWIQRSAALHRLNCSQEAALVLQSAMEKFPRDWMIPYELARLACLSGQWEQTWNWLVIALGIGDPEKVRAMVFNDPDLRPFLARFGKIDSW